MKLEIQDVSCGYEAGHPIVKNVSFQVSSGEICCILGPNGVGKSTLFKTILHLLPTLGGKVCVDGEDTTCWKPAQIARKMAYVEQAHIPAFPYLVRDVAMFGRMGQIGTFRQPSKHDYEVVEQVLDLTGIRHLRDRVYTDISGGERQLLMIARALAQEPQILILDEPTANLDYGNMILVMECIQNLAKQGICVIFTSHMPDQAFYCNAKTLLLFRDHSFVFGDAAYIVTEKNLYEAYHSQVQVLELLNDGGEKVRFCVPRFQQRLQGRSDTDRTEN